MPIKEVKFHFKILFAPNKEDLKKQIDSATSLGWKIFPTLWTLTTRVNAVYAQIVYRARFLKIAEVIHDSD